FRFPKCGMRIRRIRNNEINRKMSITLHTDLGDIKIELFCEACPKTCEVNRKLFKKFFFIGFCFRIFWLSAPAIITIIAYFIEISKVLSCKRAIQVVLEKVVQVFGIESSRTNCVKN